MNPKPMPRPAFKACLIEATAAIGIGFSNDAEIEGVIDHLISCGLKLKETK